MQTSTMRCEIGQIPAAVSDLLSRSGTALRQAGGRIRDLDPAVVLTAARGSSDHAASYLKYAIELTAGLPVASLGPSIASIFHARLRVPGAATIAISQSGRSPDLVGLAEAASHGGAFTLALTNTPGSPLTRLCDLSVDIAAGPERSVAATKTYVNSVVAGLSVLGHWTRDDQLLGALDRLPDFLGQAIEQCNWSALGQGLDPGASLFVLGRGPTLAIAREAALKFKEVCTIHAEAYSAAEVMHGPLALIKPGFPVLALAARDAGQASIMATAHAIATKGAAVYATSESDGEPIALPFVATGHPLTDPLTLIAGFYAFIEELARQRGLDPDHPAHLQKVTETR